MFAFLRNQETNWCLQVEPHTLNNNTQRSRNKSWGKEKQLEHFMGFFFASDIVIVTVNLFHEFWVKCHWDFFH